MSRLFNRELPAASAVRHRPGDRAVGPWQPQWNSMDGTSGMSMPTDAASSKHQRTFQHYYFRVRIEPPTPIVLPKINRMCSEQDVAGFKGAVHFSKTDGVIR